MNRQIASASARALRPEQVGRLMDASPEAALLTDRAGIIQYVNPAFQALTGYSPEEAIGRTPSIVKSGRLSREFYQRMWGTLMGGQEFRGVLINRRKSGELFHEEKTIRPLFDSRGRITHFLSAGHDVSDRLAQEQLSGPGDTHDALTGLPGRALFLDRVDQTLSRLRRSGERFALAVVDIDGFHAIDQTLGRADADALLRSVGQRLSHCVRAVDTVARLEADRFALLLPGAQGEGGTACVLRTIVKSFDDPFVAAGGSLRLTVSVGACLGNADAAGAAALLQRAEAVVLQVKRAGGGDFRLQEAEATAGDAVRAVAPRLDFQTAQEALLLQHQVPLTRKGVRRGDRLCRTGQEFRFLYVLHAGSVRLESFAADGREQVIALRFKGDWLGLDGIATRRYAFDTVAMETGEVWAIRYDALLKACAAAPGVQALLHAAMSREVLRDRELQLTVNTLPTEARVADFLRRWAQGLSQRGLRTDRITLHMTRGEIGNYLGMTLESVSRAMSRLAREKLIAFGNSGRRDVEIVDVAGLDAFIARSQRP
ncbi:MAG TPA: diguanylate cyclase [Albitalea sp.]|nr:diguanylate cyclase [Albitalea sp.]